MRLEENSFAQANIWLTERLTTTYQREISLKIIDRRSRLDYLPSQDIAPTTSKRENEGNGLGVNPCESRKCRLGETEQVDFIIEYSLGEYSVTSSVLTSLSVPSGLSDGTSSRAGKRERGGGGETSPSIK